MSTIKTIVLCVCVLLVTVVIANASVPPMDQPPVQNVVVTDDQPVQPTNPATVTIDPMQYKYFMMSPEGLYASNAPVDEMSYHISDSGAFRIVFEGEYQPDSTWRNNKQPEPLKTKK